MRVLLVEDHLPLANSVTSLLESQGWTVDFASDGRIALRLALSDPPDLLLLDVGLPGLTGLSLCQQLRAQSAKRVPVLMLTARDTLEDKLAGFGAGADDYLVKPFASAELLARCRALNQRFAPQASGLLRLGAVELDPSNFRVWRRSLELSLQRAPFTLLMNLLQAHPRTLLRSQLIEQLWPEQVPASDPLRSHLHALRVALDRNFDTPMLITVHGVGYRLNGKADDDWLAECAAKLEQNR